MQDHDGISEFTNHTEAYQLWSHTILDEKKINRKVQEEPQAEVAANPWYQKEEKKKDRLKYT